jgi:hypothetical protein
LEILTELRFPEIPNYYVYVSSKVSFSGSERFFLGAGCVPLPFIGIPKAMNRLVVDSGMEIASKQ